MQQKNKNSIILQSTFHTNAHLKTSWSHLKVELEKLAYLKPLSYGTSIRYSLYPFDSSYACFIEFSKNAIDYSFSFSIPSEIEYTRNLLAFISILSFLKVCYDIDFSQIYSYLIEALQTVIAISPKQANFNADAFSKRIEELCKSNLVLSKEILSLEYKIERLRNRIEHLSTFVIGAVSNAPRLPDGEYNYVTLALNLGLEQEVVAKAIDVLKEGE